MTLLPTNFSSHCMHSYVILPNKYRCRMRLNSCLYSKLLQVVRIRYCATSSASVFSGLSMLSVGKGSTQSLDESLGRYPSRSLLSQALRSVALRQDCHLLAIRRFELFTPMVMCCRMTWMILGWSTPSDSSSRGKRLGVRAGSSPQNEPQPSRCSSPLRSTSKHQRQSTCQKPPNL